jgi:hypothetical protein
MRSYGREGTPADVINGSRPGDAALSYAPMRGIPTEAGHPPALTHTSHRKEERVVFAAVVLIAGLNVEIDLSVLFRRRNARTPTNLVCGIKVVGYHVVGQPGQQFGYGGETFTIPREGFVEIIADPRLRHYVVEGRERLLHAEAWPVDGFGFRWITLPTKNKGGEQP